MLIRKQWLRTLAAFVVAASSVFWANLNRATADNAVGTPVLVATTAPAVLTPTAALLTPTPAPLPTVVQERSRPIATIAAPPTIVQQVEVPTSTAVPEATRAGTPVPTVSTVTGVATAVPQPEWPSAAQLQQDARLRWGNGIPASVRRWAFLIVPAAHRYHLDPDLLAAIMTMESNGDPLALSPADARGLMQILQGPWDPKANVDEGARMIAELYAQFGDWNLVLAGYNAGAGAVIEYNGIPPYRETQDYVVIVNYLWDLYGHHHLGSARKSLYRRTLGDLKRFVDQRNKVRKLARIAHVIDIPPGPCPTRACDLTPAASPELAADPFWPAPGAPDPLQPVTPYSSRSHLAIP